MDKKVASKANNPVELKRRIKMMRSATIKKARPDEIQNQKTANINYIQKT